jgi:hypothetical protein
MRGQPSLRERRRLARLTCCVAAACGLALTTAPVPAHGQTWVGGTGSNWSTTANWNPTTVPNTSSATATFGNSTNTSVSVNGGFQVGSLVFTNAATTPYTIGLVPGGELFFQGAGITNNSGINQSITTATDTSGDVSEIQFNNSASAGSNITITNAGSVATFQGATTTFNDSSSAGSATIINQAGTAAGGGGGETFFSSSSSSSVATAASANITNNGASVSGASGGLTQFYGFASAGNSVITTNGGTNGGAGGVTMFVAFADGGTAQAITNASTDGSGSGTFDVSEDSTVKIGSIAGSGNYMLGQSTLTVGGNNLSTTVSGVISDGGLGGGT